MKPLNDKWLFLFIAPPSGGKGTQTQYLSDYFHIPRIDTGAELRRIGSTDSELGQRIRSRIEFGHLVDSEIVVEVLENKLLALVAEQPNVKAYILDGYPRNRDQATELISLCERLGAKVARAFYLKVPQEVILDRVINRRICPKCGAIYNLKSKAPLRENRCDTDGTMLTQRVDDEPDKVSTRLNSFEAETRPMIALFREDGTLVKLNGDRHAADISEELIQWMVPYL